MTSDGSAPDVSTNVTAGTISATIKGSVPMDPGVRRDGLDLHVSTVSCHINVTSKLFQKYRKLSHQLRTGVLR